MRYGHTRLDHLRQRLYKGHDDRCHLQVKNLSEADPTGRVSEDMKYAQKRWKDEAARVLKAGREEIRFVIVEET